MSMEIQFLYEDRNGDRQRATFTEESLAKHFHREFIEHHPNRELLVETHDYRGGDL